MGSESVIVGIVSSASDALGTDALDEESSRFQSMLWVEHGMVHSNDVNVKSGLSCCVFGGGCCLLSLAGAATYAAFTLTFQR